MECRGSYFVYRGIEIKANLVLFNTAKKHFDLEQFLIEIGPKANRAMSC